jgi:hypothetical protein
MVAVRLRAGTPLPNGRCAGETDREVHFVPSPTAGQPNESITALCGTALGHGGIEHIHADTGVPCAGCLLQFLSPSGTHPAVPRQRWREW